MMRVYTRVFVVSQENRHLVFYRIKGMIVRQEAHFPSLPDDHLFLSQKVSSGGKLLSFQSPGFEIKCPELLIHTQDMLLQPVSKKSQQLHIQ